MTTATEYRKYARECIESARDSTSQQARNQFLALAKLWLAAGARVDAKLSSKKNKNAGEQRLKNMGYTPRPRRSSVG